MRQMTSVYRSRIGRDSLTLVGEFYCRTVAKEVASGMQPKHFIDRYLRHLASRHSGAGAKWNLRQKRPRHQLRQRERVTSHLRNSKTSQCLRLCPLSPSVKRWAVAVAVDEGNACLRHKSEALRCVKHGLEDIPEPEAKARPEPRREQKRWNTQPFAQYEEIEGPTSTTPGLTGAPVEYEGSISRASPQYCSLTSQPRCSWIALLLSEQGQRLREGGRSCAGSECVS